MLLDLIKLAFNTFRGHIFQIGEPIPAPNKDQNFDKATETLTMPTYTFLPSTLTASKLSKQNSPKRR